MLNAMLLIRAAVLNSSPHVHCTFRMLLLSLETFVLFEHKCPANWTLLCYDSVQSERIYSNQSALKCARHEFK